MAVNIDAQNSYPVTRADAQALGVSRYFTRKPCKHGHIAFRYVANKSCAICQDLATLPPEVRSIKRKKAYEANKEHELELSGIWYNNNKDRKREVRYIWLDENAEHVRETQYAWNAANPDAYLAIFRNRRARKKASGGSHGSEDILFLMQTQGARCAHSWCRASLKLYKEVDHIIPIARGGSNDRRNLQLLCGPCNRKKSDCHPIDFAQRNGLLL